MRGGGLLFWSRGRCARKKNPSGQWLRVLRSAAPSRRQSKWRGWFGSFLWPGEGAACARCCWLREKRKKVLWRGRLGKKPEENQLPFFPPICPIRQVCLYEGKGSSGEGRGTGDHQSSCQLLWGSCLGSSPDFQPKKRDQKMVLDPGSGSSALWAQGSRKDIKSPPSLIVKLPPLGNSV